MTEPSHAFEDFVGGFRPHEWLGVSVGDLDVSPDCQAIRVDEKDRKSTRLNSSHITISYAVFCLKKKKKNINIKKKNKKKKKKSIYNEFIEIIDNSNEYTYNWCMISTSHLSLIIVTQTHIYCVYR